MCVVVGISPAVLRAWSPLRQTVPETACLLHRVASEKHSSPLEENAMEVAIEKKTDFQSEPKNDDPARVEMLARRCLCRDHIYRFYFKDIVCHYENGVLTLQGRLPTFYLKQVLQTMVRDVDGVVKIDNQVDVVSATGISSVRSAS
jgi:osmotically-inducible protein OsmY